MITDLLIKDSSDNKNNNNSTPAKVATTNVVQSVALSQLSLQSRVYRYWKELNLRRKATIVALTIGILPIATVGGLAHHLATESLRQQIINDQESATLEMRQKVSLVTNHLINDLAAMARLPTVAIGTIPMVRATIVALRRKFNLFQ